LVGVADLIVIPRIPLNSILPLISIPSGDRLGNL